MPWSEPSFCIYYTEKGDSQPGKKLGGRSHCFSRIFLLSDSSHPNIPTWWFMFDAVLIFFIPSAWHLALFPVKADFWSRLCFGQNHVCVFKELILPSSTVSRQNLAVGCESDRVTCCKHL